MAKNILVVVDMQTAEAQKAAADLAGEVKSLGEALSDQSEEVHKFRSGIDDAVEQLNIFGDAGAALVGEINKISDPMKRLAVANEIIASTSTKAAQDQRDLQDAFNASRVKAISAAGGVEQYEAKLADMKDSLDAIRDPQRRAALEMELAGKGTNRLGAFTQNLSDTFHTQRARLISAVGGLQNYTMLLGAAGVAAGVLVGIVGGTLAAAYSRASNGLGKYIEKNKEAAALQEFATKAADANAQELGKSVYKLSSDFELAQADSTSFFDEILIKITKISQNTPPAQKALDNLFLSPAKQAIPFIGILENGIDVFGRFGFIVEKLAAPLKNTFNATQTLTQTFNATQVAVNLLTLSLQTYGAQLDEIARKASSATPYLDALSGKELSGQSGSTALPIKAALSRRGGAGVQPAKDDSLQKFDQEIAKAQTAKVLVRSRQSDLLAKKSDEIDQSLAKERENLAQNIDLWMVYQKTLEETNSVQVRSAIQSRLPDLFGSIQDSKAQVRSLESRGDELRTSEGRTKVSDALSNARADVNKARTEGLEKATDKAQKDRIKQNEEEAKTTQFVANTFTSFAGGFVEQSAQIAAAMSGQGGAWKAWQAAGLSSIAALAGAFADFFLAWGTANFGINPGLAAAAIAGGIALKAIAGATAGAADRIGAKDSKRATTAARAAEPVSSGRNQGDDRPIILEMDGNRLAHTVSPYLSRAARNGILTLRPTT